MRQNPYSFQIWLEAARPKTLWAAVVPVMMGGAMALGQGRFHLLAFLAALAGALLIQIGTNFSNDYFDFLNGADTADRLGPRRATQAGLVTPAQMKNAFILTFGLALLIGFWLAFQAGWVIFMIGIVAVLSGIFYTAGPKPLGYLGLGDLFVLIFFGPVAVGGTYYVQALEFYPPAFWMGFAPGLLSTAILTVNNLRDEATDRIAGKRTLVVRFGILFGRIEYLFCVLVACVLPLLFFQSLREHPHSLFASFVFFFALPSLVTVFRKTGKDLNPVLGKTGKLLLLYGVIFSVGWLV